MRKILTVLTLFTVLLVLALATSLKIQPITPYVSLIESSSKDLDVLTKELKRFNKHTSNKILQQGNYPITIDFKEFDGEDVDSLGYAIVDNSICEINLNLSEKWNRVKLRLVLFHEIGHCFGLDHDDSVAIMNEAYSDGASELKSLPLFYEEILTKEKVILVSQSGNPWVDEKMNNILDELWPQTKDSFSRKIGIKQSKSSFKFKANEAKKMNYEETP